MPRLDPPRVLPCEDQAPRLLPNAFTVGAKDSYDRSISSGAVTKFGARPVGDADFPDGYGGGWVWRREAVALAWLCGVDPPGGPAEFRRAGDMTISFDGRAPVLCCVYGLVLPNGWDEDVSGGQMEGPLYSEFDPFRPHALLRDALVVPAP